MDIRKYFHLSLTVFHVVRTIFKVFQDQRQLVNEAAIKITSNYCDSTSASSMKTYISLCELLQPGGNAIVGWLDGGFHDHGLFFYNFHDHPHVQRNERLLKIFKIFQFHLPDICVAIPAGVSNLRN